MAADTSSTFRYDAFISYRRDEPDLGWAKWLHGALETYRVPRELVAKGLPRRLTRVFRDEEDLSADADLSSQITAALEQSKFLIVVCSPRAVESRWVNAEVEHFRKLGRHDKILALLIEGEPRESFPKALVEIRKTVVEQGADGAATTREVIEDVEPLAADVRPERSDQKAHVLRGHARLRLLACILGCRFDDLRQRDAERRAKRLRTIGAGLAALVLVMVGLTGFALAQRSEAKRQAGIAEQKAEAESKARQLASEKTAEVVKKSDEIEWASYVANVEVAAASFDQRQWDRLRQRLDAAPPSRRGWEWWWLHAQSDNSVFAITYSRRGAASVAIRADGSQLVSIAGLAATVHDAETGVVLTKLKGHTSPLTCVAVSRDGKWIVTGSEDGAARVWDAATGAGLAELVGHSDRLNSVAFNSDSTWIVTASRDGSARVWSIEARTTLVDVKAHGPLNSAELSPDGTRVLLKSDNSVLVSDAASGESLYELVGIRSASFSPDGSQIAAGADGPALVQDMKTGAISTKLRGHPQWVNSVAFSPDGTRIVTASEDSTARVWDAKSGASLAELKGHSGRVKSAAFSPDGSWIVTASADTTARVWDASTGTSLGELRGHKDTVCFAEFISNGARVVTASEDTTARVWEVRAGHTSIELAHRRERDTPVAFSPDGRRIVSVGAGTAQVSDAATGARLAELKGHTGYVFSAAFNPDGTRIVTASTDKTARVWDAENGASLAELTGHTSSVVRAAFSPDGTRIVTASSDKTARVWDAATGNCLAELRGHPKPVYLAVFSPDNNRVLTACEETVRVWTSANWAVISEWVPLGFPMAGFSPESTRVLICSGLDSPQVRGVYGATEVVRLEGPIQASAAFSPDGTRVIGAARNGTARVWDATTGSILTELKGHTETVNSAVFSPDGARIVTASNDGTARVWDAATGASLAEIKGHASYVRSAAFSPDGTRIVTASEDGTARVWDCVPHRLRYAERAANARGEDGYELVIRPWLKEHRPAGTIATAPGSRTGAKAAPAALEPQARGAGSGG